MNKCWFVLEQSFYTAPVYTTTSRAGGQTESGNLRLGDGTLPRFGREMRITQTQLGEFKWDQIHEREDSANAGAGASTTAAGATLSAEISAEFKRTMKTWANFKTLNTEVVQPSTTYIDEVIAHSDVQKHIEQHKTPLLNRWTVYVVIGLMIARASGSIGGSEMNSQTFHGSTDLDIADAANSKIGGTHKNSIETHKSVQIQGDRVWAVRFAKIHKGLLRRKWMQTEETAGAALDGDEEGEEQVQKVLEHEGLRKAVVTECTTALGSTETWSLVTMVPDATHDA